jgi:putative methanogenesis marker protein 7
MEELQTLVYDGGIYRFNELVETIEDTGSFILRRVETAVSVTAVIAVYCNDREIIQKKAEELGGKLARAPLAGTEIAVIAPSPSNRHLPHPTCDIAEYLRRSGAQTLLISLARGVGQDPLISADEERLINECDLAVFAMGDARFCLENKKGVLFRNLRVPVVVAAGPDVACIPETAGYVGGFGRRTTRMIGSADIALLDDLVGVVDRCIDDRRRAIYPHLPSVALPSLSQKIADQVPEIKDVLSPSPITIKLDGLRIKLPYGQYSTKVSDVLVDGQRLGDLASISRSVLKDQILVKLEQ